MADKTVSTRTLNLTLGFNDGDDRLLTVDNPKVSNLVMSVKALESFIKQKNALIGDKQGADFTGIKTASVKNRSVTQLDLT